jgi:hypothetical protein
MSIQRRGRIEMSLESKAKTMAEFKLFPERFDSRIEWVPLEEAQKLEQANFGLAEQLVLVSQWNNDLAQKLERSTKKLDIDDENCEAEIGAIKRVTEMEEEWEVRYDQVVQENNKLCLKILEANEILDENPQKPLMKFRIREALKI